jgi:hypothetical protein
MAKFIIDLQHQEDENSPRGTRFYAEIVEPLNRKILSQGEGASWGEAASQAVTALYHQGVI